MSDNYDELLVALYDAFTDVVKLGLQEGITDDDINATLEDLLADRLREAFKVLS